MDDLKRWFLVLRIPAALLGVALFFSAYNRLLLDRNLQSLQTSLSVLDASTEVGQAEAALLLVDQTLMNQMAQEQLDLQAVSTLQYARGTLGTDQVDRPVDDAQAMLELVGKAQASSRPPLLRAMDGLVLRAQGAARDLALLPRQALAPALSPEMDQFQLGEAARLERLGRLAETAQIYEMLLQDYPQYSGRLSMKLRLGYVRQQMGELKVSDRLYREVQRESRDPKEIQTAQQMLQGLSQTRALRGQAKQSEKRLARLPAGADRQKSLFRLGTDYLRLREFDKAAQAFQEAYREDPEGDLALSSRYKEAWALRASGRFEEAFQRFAQLLESQPDSDWAVAAYLQIADIYKALGDLQAAGDAHARAAAVKTKNAAFTAAAIAQAATTHQYDLNDPEKAQAFYRQLETRYPASSYSGLQRRIANLARKKYAGTQPPAASAPIARPGPAPAPAPAPAPSLAADSPLLKWIEDFLPIFVETFMDRLARYMEVAGEKQLTRRFTQEEFRALVVRRVQEKFPGRVKGVVTEIHADGFVGAATLAVGPLHFTIRAKVGIVVQNNRPHTVVQEILVGKVPLPGNLLKYLEGRVNLSIDRAKYPLKVKQYELREGYALISVELEGNP